MPDVLVNDPLKHMGSLKHSCCTLQRQAIYQITFMYIANFRFLMFEGNNR